MSTTTDSSSRTRVLHLIHDLEMGGAQRVIVQIVRHLDPEVYDQQVVSLFDPVGSGVEETLREQGVPVHYLGKQPGFDPQTFRHLNQVLKDTQVDVLHSHCYALMYAFPVAWWRRVPAKIHTMHTLADTEMTRSIGKQIYRAGFERDVVPVAIIQEVAASLKRVYGIENAAYIPNGVPVEDFQHPQTARSDWRTAHGFGPDEVLFTCIARLKYPKNQAGMLRAWAQGPGANPKLHLILVGEGPDRPELEALVRELGLESQVHFLGERTDVPDILGASDVFLLFSTYEGNPLSVMEAMAAGKPVLSSAVGGIPELVEEGRAGVLVASEDEAALAAAIMELAADPERRAMIGKRAAERAEAHFSAKAMAEAYERLYREVLSGKLVHG